MCIAILPHQATPSPRLEQKRESKEHRDHIEPPHTHTGKRNRAQEEITGAQPSAKKRKTGDIATVIPEQKRKRGQESEATGAQPIAKKRKTGYIASAVPEQKRKRGQESEITGTQPSVKKRKTGYIASEVSEQNNEGATGEDYSQQSRITNTTGQLRAQKRKRGSDAADDKPQTSQRQALEHQTKKRKVGETEWNETAGTPRRRSARTRTGTGISSSSEHRHVGSQDQRPV